VAAAPPIDSDSWLNLDSYAEFRSAYAYASTQTRAIGALSRLEPEEVFYLFEALECGSGR
jgi:hypothetical protein